MTDLFKESVEKKGQSVSVRNELNEREREREKKKGLSCTKKSDESVSFVRK